MRLIKTSLVFILVLGIGFSLSAEVPSGIANKRNKAAFKQYETLLEKRFVIDKQERAIELELRAGRWSQSLIDNSKALVKQTEALDQAFALNKKEFDAIHSTPATMKELFDELFRLNKNYAKLMIKIAPNKGKISAADDAELKSIDTALDKVLIEMHKIKEPSGAK